MSGDTSVTTSSSLPKKNDNRRNSNLNSNFRKSIKVQFQSRMYQYQFQVLIGSLTLLTSERKLILTTRAQIGKKKTKLTSGGPVTS